MAETATKSKEAVVQMLVEEHFADTPELERVVWLRGAEPDEEIRLLHVDQLSIPSEEVISFRFGPTEDVPFFLRLAAVRPAEWDELVAGRFRLPLEWTLDGAAIFERASGESA